MDRDHLHEWVEHDGDHVHEWQSSEEGAGRKQMRAGDAVDELEQDIAFDLAEAKVAAGDKPIAESCTYSQCSRDRTPLRRELWESKFPFSGAPRSISPPGWTYAPRRKTRSGKYWDKEWPRNYRYIYHDPSLQPCGCPLTKRHAGSRTPSRANSPRERGLACVESLNINRERSISPRSPHRGGPKKCKHKPKLGSGTHSRSQSAGSIHGHSHRLGNWSCSTSEGSSRAPTPGGSRKVYPRLSPARSGGSTPRRKHGVPLAGAVVRSQSPASSRGCSPFSLSPRNILKRAVAGAGTCAGLLTGSCKHSPPNTRAGSPARTRNATPTRIRISPPQSRAATPSRPRKPPAISRAGSPGKARADPCGPVTPTTPCICRQHPPGTEAEEAGATQERRRNSFGHSHVYGDWSCSPDEGPTPPRSRTPTPPRTPDYTVTITYPPTEAEDIPEPEPIVLPICHCHHCYCRPAVEDDPSDFPAIAGSSDWDQVSLIRHHHDHHHHHHHHPPHCCAHHHHRMSYCCSCCFDDWL